MALVTRYVNTASSAGGNGTTSGTSGANRAYATLAAALTAEQKNLQTAGDSYRIVCLGGVDTSRPNITSTWNTNSSHTLEIVADAGSKHTAVAKTGYRIIPSSQGGSSYTMQIATDYVTIDGLEISLMGSTSGYTLYDTAAVNLVGCENVAIKNCILWYEGTSYRTNGIIGRGNTGAISIAIENCIVYGFKGIGIGNFEYGFGNNVHFTVSNCIVDRCGDNSGEGLTGLYVLDGYAPQAAFTVNNCMAGAILPSGVPCFDDPTSAVFGGDYNFSTDTSAPGVNSVHSVSLTTSTGAGTRYIVQSLTAGSEDYRLVDDPTNAAIDAGATGAGIPTTDIEGEDRDSDPDIGPDEIVAAGEDQEALGILGGVSVDGIAAAVSTSENKFVTAVVGDVALTGTPAAVSATENRYVAGAQGDAQLEGIPAAVTTSESKFVAGELGGVAVTGHAATVDRSEDKFAAGATSTLELNPFPAAVSTSENKYAAGSNGELTLLGISGQVATTEHKQVAGAAGVLRLQGTAGSVNVTQNKYVTGALKAVNVSGQPGVVNTAETEQVAGALAPLQITGLPAAVVVTENRWSVGMHKQLGMAGLPGTTSYTGHVWVTGAMGTLTLTSIAATIQVLDMLIRELESFEPRTRSNSFEPTARTGSFEPSMRRKEYDV